MSDQTKFTSVNIFTMPDGKRADPQCPNLYIWVRNQGKSRVWQFRANGRPDINIGSLKIVGLKEARDTANKLRSQVFQGEAPTTKTIRAPAPVKAAASTFKQDALAYYEHAKGEWSELHAKYWLQSMERHAFRKLGSLDTAKVTVNDIVSCLEPIWTKHHGTAIRLHGRIKVTIDYAMDCDDDARFIGNPADRALRRLPKGVGADQVPHPTICWKDAPALYKALTASDDQAAQALRLLLLCGTPRANEINGALWSEIDGTVLHVPAERMKSGNARDIPLSGAALEILASLSNDRTGFLFTGRKGKVMGGKRDRTEGKDVVTGGTFVPFSGGMHRNSMQILLRTINPNCHVHGLRSTFRTWCSDHAQTVRDHDAAEICLDHTIGNRVHRSYDRTDMMPERRSLLERWAAFLMA